MGYLKRIMAVVLCIMMAATTQTTTLLAQTTENAVEKTITTDELDLVTPDETQQPSVNYIVVGSPYVETPGTQNILASVGDGTKNVESAVLNYKNVQSGKNYQAKANSIDKDELFFSMDFTDAAMAGQYDLVSIEVRIDGTHYVIDLKEKGIEASFGVDQSVQTAPDAVVEEDDADVSMDVVTIDEDGNTTSEATIEDAIANAQDGNVNSTGADGDVVVVLDPGHDASHGGTSAGGLAEAELNLKIAKYCKTELETYEGVIVYMTRTTSACPHPGTTSGDDNALRVDYAKSVNANIYVAIHNNMSPDSSTKGAEVFYPNGNGNAAVGAAGKSLAQKIQDQLVALGLYNRGISIRNSEAGDSFADGTLMDYYGVIRRAKTYGIPGVIVEHAFQSNASDVASFLGNNSGLKKLGVADATGIAKYFGLEKEGSGVSKPSIRYAKSNKTNIQLAWNTAAGVTGYQIYRSTNNKNFSRITTIRDANTATYEDETTEAGVTYYYKMRAFLTVDGVHTYSKYCDVVNGQLLNMPTMSYVQSIGAKSLRLGWTKVDSATGYQIYRSDALDGKYTKVKTITSSNTTKYVDATAETGVTYYYKIRAYLKASGTTGYSESSAAISGYTAATPKISSITSSSSKKLTINWNQIENATGYKIQRSTSKNGKYKTIARISSGATTSYTDSGLTMNKRYYYRVLANNSINGKKGYGDYSSAKSGWVTATPTITKAQAISSQRIQIQWTAVDRATGYEIFRSTSANSGYQKISTVASTTLSYKDKAPTANRKYYYKVRAVMSSGSNTSYGSNSKAVYGKAIAKAEIKKIYSVNEDKIRMNWNAVSGANGYKISRSTSKNGKYQTIATIASGKTTSYTDASIKTGRKYYYKIEATNRVNKVVGNSGKSSAYAARTVAKATISSAVSKSAGTLVLTWNDVSNESGYQIKRSTTVNGSYTTLATLAANTTTYTDRTAEAGVTYYYKINVTNKVGNVTGNSGNSKAVSGIVLAKPSVRLSVAMTGVNVRWNVISGATGYYVQRSDTINGTYKTIKKVTVGTEVSYVDTTAESNKEYYYRVRAINESTSPKGVSAYSTSRGITNAMEIMGTSTVTVAQMVAAFNASNRAYPTEVYASKGAATIEEFCQIVLNEAAAEGVRAEVVFAQICVETGYLQFGGQVSAEQCNFCGLGAVDGGAAGATFESVAIGVRAQVQHLKGYATTGDLNQTCVDPRFSLLATRRGKAPYVEWLSIPNNPYTTYDANGIITFGCGWASDAEYGPKLVTMIKTIQSY